MNVGYARVSKTGDAQNLDLQVDALTGAGVAARAIYEDRASGKKESRPGLDACLKALRRGDTLVVWKLDRLGRDLRHLVHIVRELTEREVGLRVLTGQGAQIDTATPAASSSASSPPSRSSSASSSASAPSPASRPPAPAGGAAAGSSPSPRRRCASPRPP